jgi:hypothetical protein
VRAFATASESAAERSEMEETLFDRLLGLEEATADFATGKDVGGAGKDAERDGGPERCGCGGVEDAVMGSWER